MSDPNTEELAAARAMRDAAIAMHGAWDAFLLNDLGDNLKLALARTHAEAGVVLSVASAAYDAKRAANPWQPGQALSVPTAELKMAGILLATAKRYWLERAVKACDIHATAAQSYFNQGWIVARETIITEIRALITAEDPALPDPAQVRRAALEEAAAAVCPACAAHYPIEIGVTDSGYPKTRHKLPGGYLRACDAVSIRALMGKPDAR